MGFCPVGQIRRIGGDTLEQEKGKAPAVFPYEPLAFNSTRRVYRGRLGRGLGPGFLAR